MSSTPLRIDPLTRPDRAPDRLLDLPEFKAGPPVAEIAERCRRLGRRDLVRLDSNENALGPSPRVAEAVSGACLGAHRYPDHDCFALRGELAASVGLAGPEGVILGQGSTEVIDLLVRAFVEPGERVVVSRGAFLGFWLMARRAHAEIVRPLPRADDRRTDLGALADAVLDEPTRLVYVDNPNNPTGTYNTHDEIVELLEAVGERTLVILDEAYREYVEQDDFPRTPELIRQGYPVVALGTFSKIHALAGLRLGYGFAQPEIVERLERLRPPYNTSSVAQAAGRAALLDFDHQERSRRDNAVERAFLTEGLAALGVDVAPSVTNFLFFETSRLPPAGLAPAGLAPAGLTPAGLARDLFDLGIMVRPTAAYGFPAGLRVSVGTREETQAFLETFDGVISRR